MNILMQLSDQQLALFAVWGLPVVLGLIMFLVALVALVRLNRLRQQQHRALERVDNLLLKVTTVLDRYLTRTEPQAAATIERSLEQELQQRQSPQ